jgi:hypothetical protein
MKPSSVIGRLSLAVALLIACHASGSGAEVVPAGDPTVLAGLSPYNWVAKGGRINSTVNGASITLAFTKTRQVALAVDTGHQVHLAAGRFPIIAWTVNGGAAQTHQLAAAETSVVLATGVADPVIDLYVKGFSPFEDRFSGDVPVNSIVVTGFALDAGGKVAAAPLPERIWLDIGDSIMSGDATSGKGRPADDLWAASDDGRASYGYLLAQHFGYREARLAFGGYDWAGGMANVPALSVLIDQKTSTVSRLEGGALKPAPSVVLINLGENGAPADADVIRALEKLRSRVTATTRVIVMIPVSGRGRAEITRAFAAYKVSTKDEHAYLIDAGQTAYATTDGQHPSAAGHQAIYEKALPLFVPVVAR